MALLVDIEKQLGKFRLRASFTAGNETLALLGASGCGKSMTLQCIAGIVTPDHGRIVLDDRVLFDSEQHVNLPPQARSVGYLFQQYALFPSMTVEQNIRCGIRAGSRREKAAAAAEKIRMFRLEGMEKKLPAQLSGGQQQRVALARILASEPGTILLDEPFSALDGYLKWNLELEMADLLAGFSGTVVWVSHDLDEVYRNCPRVCVMENGRTGEVVSMDVLLCNPGTVSAARLVGCKNFLPVQLGERGLQIPGWGFTLPNHFGGQDFDMLGIPTDAVERSPVGIEFRIVRATRSVGGTIYMLRPTAAGVNAPMLRAELPDSQPLPAGSTLRLRLIEDQLMPLHASEEP